jgi:hypothetical protein
MKNQCINALRKALLHLPGLSRLKNYLFKIKTASNASSGACCA